jgi:hypothetical protein
MAPIQVQIFHWQQYKQSVMHFRMRNLQFTRSDDFFVKSNHININNPGHITCRLRTNPSQSLFKKQDFLQDLVSRFMGMHYQRAIVELFTFKTPGRRFIKLGNPYDCSNFIVQARNAALNIFETIALIGS